MKTSIAITIIGLSAILTQGCGTNEQATTDSGSIIGQQSGQSAVKDDISKADIVKVAVASADHSTLVAGLKAAAYVDVLSNAGPFTVFAPTNAAFDALPAGALDNLLKKENQADLRNVLEYHVYVGVLKEDYLQDGQILGMVSGHNATIAKDGTTITINGAKVLGTAEASNGIIYIVDAVLLPPQ